MKAAYKFSGSFEIAEDLSVWYGGFGTPLLPLASLDDIQRYFAVTASVRITNLEDAPPELTLQCGGISYTQTLTNNTTLSCVMRTDRNWASTINILLMGASAADIGTTAEYDLVIQEV